MNGGDVTNHIAKVLEITEWIKIPDVEKNELRLHVFSKSLSGDVRIYQKSHENSQKRASTDTRIWKDKEFKKKAKGQFKSSHLALSQGSKDTSDQEKHNGNVRINGLGKHCLKARRIQGSL
ncbi:hypothetical protein Tco_0982232 [Tanacetum coccineum]